MENFEQEPTFEGDEQLAIDEKLKTSCYEYQILDTKPGAVNEAYDLGIEVTNPKLASLARLGNLDPQHGSNGNPETSAIEEATIIDLPKENSILATIRPDADSIGAMAVLELRRQGLDIDINTIKAIGRIDGLGPKAKEVWPEIEDYKKLTMAASKFCLGKNSIEEKVQFMKELLTGTCNLETIKKLADESKAELDNAERILKISEFVDGQAVLVEGNHAKAFDVGYRRAGIVIAYNPNFQRPWVKDDQETEKWTIARYSEKEEIDIKGLSQKLNELEKEYCGADYDAKNTWGGPANLVASPQGYTSKIPKEVITNTIKEYITISESRPCNCGSGLPWEKCLGIEGDWNYCG